MLYVSIIIPQYDNIIGSVPIQQYQQSSGHKPHPKSQELFYEALKAGPLYYCDLQKKVMDLLNCGTQLWNNMFCEMRDKGCIVRFRNASGKTVWTLPISQVAKPKPHPLQPDMFEAFAAAD